ncbi:cytochrome P450 [Usnea florida]
MFIIDSFLLAAYVATASHCSSLQKFFKEPRAPEVLEYTTNTPNEGLLRYTGMLGADRILVTSDVGLHEVLHEKSYLLDKWDVSKRIVGPLLGDGILVAEGDRHKIQKKKLGPAFAPRHIRDLYPIYWRKTGELITILAREAVNPETQTQSPVNLSLLAARAVLDIISVATFGGDFGTIHDPDTELSKAYGRLFAPKQKRDIRSTLAIILPRRVLQALPLQRNENIRLSNATIRTFCRESIRREKEKLAKPEGIQSVNIISVALRSQEFDEDNLVDQLMTFLVAGHETTTHSLSWAVYHLCKHPHMQKRLRSELQGHIPSLRTGMTFDSIDVEGLPYLQAVCNETLRLMPVIPMTYRQAAETTTILGYQIPARTVIVVSPYVVNRSQDHWGKDANIFNPERWLEDSIATRRASNSKYGFSTFSHGPRACIGQGFARAELAILLAGIIGSFQVQLHGQESEAVASFGVITLKPAGGLKVYLRRLND